MATTRKHPEGNRVQGQPDPPDTLLTLEEVANRLKVSVSYVRRHLIFEYRLAYVKLGARTRRVRESDLEVFLATRRVTPEDYPVAQAERTNHGRKNNRRR